jgi:hypothetical protein
VRAIAVAVPATIAIGLAVFAALQSTGDADDGPGATPGRTAQPLARVATATLLPPGGPSGATAPRGTTRVDAQRGRLSMTIAGQGLAPEGRKPVEAYAVWLVNSRRDALALGFVVPPVGSGGRFVSHRDLPPGAQRYRDVIVTLERGVSRIPEGPVVLRGPLRLPDVTASASARPGRAPPPAGRSERGG